MNSGNIIGHIVTLVDFFHSHCPDTDLMDELRTMALDRGRWPKAQALFGRIRARTLEAEKSGDTKLGTQRLYEEIVAKTLYNLSHPPAPFDADSAFFVIPNAIALAKSLGPNVVSQMVDLLGLSKSAPQN